MKPARYSFPKADTAAICAAQTLGAAGALTINGTLVDQVALNSPMATRRVFLNGIQRTVSISSTGDLTGVNFTITGKDSNGAVVTETRAGPNNSTVETTAQFQEITSVTVNGAVGTAVTLGTGSVGATQWFKTDYFRNPVNFGLYVDLTSTANVTVQYTPDPLDQVHYTNAVTNLSAITASADQAFNEPCEGVRAVMNSSSGNGAFTFTVIQSGLREA